MIKREPFPWRQRWNFLDSFFMSVKMYNHMIPYQINSHAEVNIV